MKMSIHRALGELKTLEKRINKEIENGIFIGAKKSSSETEYKTRTSIQDFENNVKSTRQSINDLIKRRKEIKEAIVNSNANTFVTIGDNKMTVAGAIERKTSIEYDRFLLSKMKEQYRHTISFVEENNEEVESDLSNKIDIMLNTNDKKNTEGIEQFSKAYRKSNGWEVVDVIDLKSLIDKLEKEITIFENEVDVVLSESNATTFIDIE